MSRNSHVKKKISREEPEWVVFVTVGVLLIIGIVITASSLSNTRLYKSETLSFEYPAAWVRDFGYSSSEQGEGGSAAGPKRFFFAQDRFEGNLYTTSLLVRYFPLPEEMGIETEEGMADFVWMGLSANYVMKPGYTALTSESVEVSGIPSIKREYGYVEVPDRTAESLPEVVYGIDILVPIVESGGVYVFTLRGEKEYSPGMKEAIGKLISTATVSPFGGNVK